MKYLVLTISLVFSTLAQAELYFVEPMICKGQWNERPPGYHESFEKAGLKITSFFSVRKKDCSLANSSSTLVDHAYANEEIVFPEYSIGNWLGSPLKIYGKKVIIPNGVRGNNIELTITSSSQENGQRIDSLSGREVLFDNYYYDLNCTAVVVKKPSHVENNTKNCP